MLAPPSASIGVAASSARSGVAQLWNGMSATSRAEPSPRETQAVWYTMSDTLTGKVLPWPCTTMPSESPTRMKSTPAASRVRAKLAS